MTEEITRLKQSLSTAQSDLSAASIQLEEAKSERRVDPTQTSSSPHLATTADHLSREPEVTRPEVNEQTDKDLHWKLNARSQLMTVRKEEFSDPKEIDTVEFGEGLQLKLRMPSSEQSLYINEVSECYRIK